MNDIWLIIFTAVAVGFLILTLFLFWITIIAFRGRSFEPIEPKGNIERKETKDKNR